MDSISPWFGSSGAYSTLVGLWKALEYLLKYTVRGFALLGLKLLEYLFSGIYCAALGLLKALECLLRYTVQPVLSGIFNKALSYLDSKILGRSIRNQGRVVQERRERKGAGMTVTSLANYAPHRQRGLIKCFPGIFG
jgi:hypothetical protein